MEEKITNLNKKALNWTTIVKVSIVVLILSIIAFILGILTRANFILLTVINLVGSIASIIGLQKNDSQLHLKVDRIYTELKNFDPTKRDQIIKQREKVIEELKAALRDEKSGNTKERMH